MNHQTEVYILLTCTAPVSCPAWCERISVAVSHPKNQLQNCQKSSQKHNPVWAFMSLWDYSSPGKRLQAWPPHMSAPQGSGECERERGHETRLEWPDREFTLYIPELERIVKKWHRFQDQTSTHSTPRSYSNLSLASGCPLAVLEAKYEIPDSPVVNVTHAEVRLRSVFWCLAHAFFLFHS